ncbi:hypothetical protein ESCO_001538 [Escovopsis weberi]|uniref:Uncharacterized protein n=1 Tax=Escovopsis weberi TaxID=150374 RepID=A0A0M9VWM6_ESCWE|nr:hypothetical protein ESCO_001538 [Escovopsis weberi]
MPPHHHLLCSASPPLTSDPLAHTGHNRFISVIIFTSHFITRRGGGGGGNNGHDGRGNGDDDDDDDDDNFDFDDPLGPATD